MCTFYLECVPFVSLFVSILHSVWTFLPIGTSVRRLSRSAFGRLTGNDVSDHYFFPFSVMTFSHRRSAPPMYKRQVSARRTFAFGVRILVPAAFWLFWRGFGFRELKHAIKNQFFLYLGGLGAILSF